MGVFANGRMCQTWLYSDVSLVVGYHGSKLVDDGECIPVRRPMLW